MASDLAATPASGLAVQACGDAHLSNFGLFGSAERRLMFDANAFDRAIAQFAHFYADQNERDYQSLVEAIASGRVTAERDA